MVTVEERPDVRPEAEFTGHQAITAAREPCLAVTDAWFSYADRPVLRGVTLSVMSGEIVVLLGPNGAGKSTLIRSLAGRISLESGSVRIEGHDPVASSKGRRCAGFVPQRVAVWEHLTMEENLASMGEIMGVPTKESRHRAEMILGAIGLADRGSDRASVLSGGMRRRLNIGMALMHAPRLLVLDEPTVGVDKRGRLGLQKLICALRDQGLAVLLVTHDMEEAESMADRVAVIVDGEIRAEGEPDLLINQLFGSARELVASLGPGGGRSPTARTALRSSGFEPDQQEDQWRRMVVWSDEEIAYFMSELLEREPGLKELKVRRPGLDTVLAHCLDHG